jgi:hypothetical protein
MQNEGSGADGRHRFARGDESAGQCRRASIPAQRRNRRAARDKKQIKIRGLKSLQRHLSLQDQAMTTDHREIILQDREHHLGPGATKDVNRSNQLQLLHPIGQQAEHALLHRKKTKPKGLEWQLESAKLAEVLLNRNDSRPYCVVANLQAFARFTGLA